MEFYPGERSDVKRKKRETTKKKGVRRGVSFASKVGQLAGNHFLTITKGRENLAALGKLTAWNGATSRLYVRKAQCHYGWDWGPTLITAGPWRPVYLQAYTARVEDIYCPSEVSADLSRATLPVRLMPCH